MEPTKVDVAVLREEVRHAVAGSHPTSGEDALGTRRERKELPTGEGFARERFLGGHRVVVEEREGGFGGPEGLGVVAFPHGLMDCRAKGHVQAQ